MDRERHNGAKWLRCDLHVHTAFDATRTFTEDCVGALARSAKGDQSCLRGIASRFVDACNAADGGEGLDLVAVTDHNSIEGYRHLAPHWDAMRSAGERLPMILPGVEVTVGADAGCHVLVVFGHETAAEDIARALVTFFGENAPFGSDGSPKPTLDGQRRFLEKLAAFCRPEDASRRIDHLVLPAHVDSNSGLWKDMRGLCRRTGVTRAEWSAFQTGGPFGSLDEEFRNLLCCWRVRRRGEDWDQLPSDEKREVREQLHWPLVECSDPHDYEDIGSRYTWLKMETPSTEGLRLAFLDPESRLRRMADGPPRGGHPVIRSLRIEHTDFIDDVTVEFTPWLNALIGGRGSGKSTVIECLRHGLDRAHAADLGGDGSAACKASRGLLKSKEDRDHGQTEGILLPGHKVTVEVTVSGSHYRIVRSADGEVVEAASGLGLAQDDIETRSLIAPRILSRRQIAEVAETPRAQLQELDALTGSDRVQDFDHIADELRDDLAACQAAYSRASGLTTGFAAKRTEQRRVSDRIALLERGSSKEILGAKARSDREETWLSDLAAALAPVVAAASGAQTAALRAADALGPPPEDAPAWMSELGAGTAELLRTTGAELAEQAEAVDGRGRAIADQTKAHWEPLRAQVDAQYRRLLEEMETAGVGAAEHETLLRKMMVLERELQKLEDVERTLPDLDQQVDDARDALVRHHLTRTAARTAMAAGLEQPGVDARMQVIPFGDRAAMEEKREKLFGGTGMREGDWSAILDYVFETGESIPERIGAVVGTMRKDAEVAAASEAATDDDFGHVDRLVSNGQDSRLSGYFRKAVRETPRERLDELGAYLPEDRVVMSFREPVTGEFRPIEHGSLGERSTAILALFLAAGEQPLVIDQPEDDLDNRYVYDIIVALLRDRKFDRQIIVATHNANIPVNGDAEMIVAFGTDGDTRLGGIVDAGSIDRARMKERVATIMEGGREAFRLRRERYGY